MSWHDRESNRHSIGIGAFCLQILRARDRRQRSRMRVLRGQADRHIIQRSTERHRGNHLPIGTAFHEQNLSSLPQPELPRVVGLLHGQRVRGASRARVQRHPQCCALIDISPLYKYLVTGKDATKLVNRVITRDINKVKVGQVIYCCWCDEEGKVIDDGTISRLEENVYRWTAADPSLRWFRQNGLNMDVQIEDISEKVAALALQGPTSAKLLKVRGRSGHREPEIFPRDPRQDRRRAGGHFAHRVHRRSWLRDLGSVE